MAASKTTKVGSASKVEIKDSVEAQIALRIATAIIELSAANKLLAKTKMSDDGKLRYSNYFGRIVDGLGKRAKSVVTVAEREAKKAERESKKAERIANKLDKKTAKMAKLRDQLAALEAELQNS